MAHLRIAVAGAGLIGRRHCELIKASPHCTLAAIIDPSESARSYAEQHGAPYFGTLADALRYGGIDGVILATPNALHVEQALQCLHHRVPALIEKPVAHTIAEGEQLLTAATRSDVPMLVGHHRAYSQILETAHALIQEGRLGRIVAVMGSALFFKPDHYFEEGPWRREQGGGPILINLIHEIGNLRALCGEIVAVEAMASNAARGFAVEDTAAMLFRFENGALGTFILSDTAASARSWEQTSHENKSYASYEDEDCYLISGDKGSLAIPTMRLKTYARDEDRSWWKPFQSSTIALTRTDPLDNQLVHFCDVIARKAPPRVSVFDGLQNLRVVEAIKMAIETKGIVTV